MRILIHGLNFAPELTGIGKYTGEMAQWLAARGHEVRVVTAPPYYPEWKVRKAPEMNFSSSNGCGSLTVYRCPLWVPQQPTGLTRILHLASFALSSFPVMLGQVFWKPEVVFVVAPALFCAPAAWLTARLSGAKAWLHVQDFEVDAAFNLGLLPSGWMRKSILFCETILLRRFDRVSTISTRMQGHLSSKGVEASRQFFFPNWVDVTAIKPEGRGEAYRAELGIGAEDCVVLYSGTMGEKQGLETLIEAARRLMHQPSIRFVLCGEGGARARLNDLGKDLPNILWLPLQTIKRLNDLLNLADIHVLPQRADAADLVMPSKLTGMLASGRPVVVTAASGTELAEVVERCGLVVKPGNDGAMAAAIYLLAGDFALRASLGAAARQYAEDHLDRDRVLERFEEALQLSCNRF